MFARLIAEGSVTVARSIAKKLTEVQITTPAIFQKPVIPGDYPTNPEANQEGLVVLVNNYADSGATISFFQFRSFQAFKGGGNPHEYPVRFNLAEHCLLEPGRMAKFVLPWQGVELAAAQARNQRIAHPKGGFQFELTAFDEFKNKYYHSGPLNEFVIRSEASRMLGRF